MIVRNDQVAKFLLESQFSARFDDKFAGFVFMRDGYPYGAAILNHFTGREVEITLATRGPITRQIIRVISGFCFQELKVARVVARTGQSNAKCRKLLEAMGFRAEGVLRRFFPDDDGVLYSLLESEMKQVSRHGR